MSAHRTELITFDPSLSNVQHCALRNCCLKSLAIFIFLYFMSLSKRKISTFHEMIRKR
jgi:hypothetical protein